MALRQRSASISAVWLTVGSSSFRYSTCLMDNNCLLAARFFHNSKHSPIEQGSNISYQVAALSQTGQLLKQDIAQQKSSSDQLLMQSQTNEQTVILKNLQHLDQRLTLLEDKDANVV